MRRTAERLLNNRIALMLGMPLALLVALASVRPLSALQLLVWSMLAFQLLLASYKMCAPLFSVGHNNRSRGWRKLSDADLPVYTIMFALYKEANMIDQILENIAKVSYPREKLQCLFVLEAHDTETIAAVEARELPHYWQLVKVPQSEHLVGGRPLKGKPRALDFAAQFAEGEFLVVFDAEDKPDPNQLKKVVAAFRNAADPRLACVQVPLSFSQNEGASWVTRLMAAEYTWHFQFLLKGLDWLGLAIPLGGTSNHLLLPAVRELALKEYQMPKGEAERGALGIWDAFNVTEDCDLGGWLAVYGYRTIVVNSWTDEEAPVTLVAAFNQRTRWVKGYAQTALVFLVCPMLYARKMGLVRYLTFLLTSGGSYLALLITPLLVAMTMTWLFLRPEWMSLAFGGEAVAWFAFWTAVIANTVIASQTIVAAIATRQWATIAAALLLPVWWAMLSLAALQAFRELVTGKAQFWNKTTHGVPIPAHEAANAATASAPALKTA